MHNRECIDLNFATKRAQESLLTSSVCLVYECVQSAFTHPSNVTDVYQL